MNSHFRHTKCAWLIVKEVMRRTCILLAVVHFWRDVAMRHQYNNNAITIGGRPGGDGIRRDIAELENM